MRNAQNYSRMLTTLLVACSFVAGIGSVSAETPGKNPAAAPSAAHSAAAKPAPAAAAKSAPVAAVKQSPPASVQQAAKPATSSAVAGVKKPAPNPTGTVAAGAAPTKKTARANQSQNQKRDAQRVQRLVPPPPPSIPLANLAVIGGSANVPSNLQYMSKVELAKLSIKLKDQMEKAKTRLDDHEKRVKAQREKIVLYTKLLQEGVVSRRDLENAKNDLDDLESRTAELEEQAMQINGDLFSIKKLTPAPKTH